MAHLNTKNSEHILSDSHTASFRSSEGDELLQVAGYMMDHGAVAMNLPNGFLFTKRSPHATESVLMATEDALIKLCNIRSAAEALGSRPTLFAATSAREAQLVTSKDDPRDQRFLTGVTTIDNRHGYCGGMDSAISRALVYAEGADVICYKVSELNLSEAERFASEMSAALPGKQLGFGYVPLPGEFKHPEHDFAALEKKLHKMGYEYFFFTQCGSMVFPSFPAADPWVLFDDQEG